MKTLHLFCMILAVALAFHACSSGTPETSDSSGVEVGLSALEGQDIEAAQEEFCNAWESDPSDSELAFGCFFSKLLLFPETEEAVTLLASFNEPAFDTEEDLLDEEGIFANADAIQSRSPWPLFNYSDFHLPFALAYTGAGGFESFVDVLLESAVTENKTVEEIQDELMALLIPLEEMETLLAVSLADTAFTFTIPGELFYLEEDILTRYNDLRFFMAALKETMVGITIIGAYDLGVDLDAVVQDGALDHEILVADLNGTGETVNGVTVDKTACFGLVQASLIRNNKSRYKEGVSLWKDALVQFDAGEPSDFFDQALDEFDIARGIEIAEDFIAAAQKETDMDSLGIELTLNLAEFFANPPDSTTLSADAGDPFVLEDGYAIPVEAYFQTLLEGIAGF